MHRNRSILLLLRLFAALALLLPVFFNGTPGGAPGKLPNGHAAARTIYYVNTATGDDNNTCLSAGAACQTITAVHTKAADGDTIQIAAGIYTEELDIFKAVTLDGEGTATTFLDGGNSFRVMQVGAASLVTVRDVTIRNGLATTGLGGGGISHNAPLSLQNVVLRDNTSTILGGGAILSNSTLELADSQVISNTTPGVGGGIFLWTGGNVTIRNSRIGDNSADQGGGIYSTGALLVEDSTIDGNHVGNFGGGLAIFANTTSLVRTTVSDNSADGYTGGVLNNVGTLNLTNVTISNNSAPNYVGLANLDASATSHVLNSTIAANTVIGPGTRYGGVYNTGDISLQNTLVAGNGGRNCLASGTWTSLGNNLSSDNFCAFTAAGDQQNADPLLAPLGNYGGPTQTHALLAGSPAIDAGNDAACPATDQRGVARPQDGDNSGSAACDTGAYETRSQLSVSDISLTEGTGGSTTATFTVNLTPTSGSTVTVQYTTSNGSAASGSDYTSASGTLTFTPGQASQPVNVTLTTDAADENDETFSLTLSNPSNADIVDGQATATIIDDDGLSSLSINDVTLDEGNSGTVNAQFTVTLSPAASGSVTVNYATSGGSALPGSDFTSASGMLTFTSGQTSKTIDVSVLADVIDEGDLESFNIILSSPTNASIADGAGLGTITDDDLARFSLDASPSLDEGDSGQKNMTFSVSLTTPAAFSATMNYQTSSGTGSMFATPGEDYIDTSGTLTFNPGETSKTFTVVILGDTFFEEEEHFSATLSDPSPITIYGTSALGFIANDDLARVFLPLQMK